MQIVNDETEELELHVIVNVNKEQINRIRGCSTATPDSFLYYNKYSGSSSLIRTGAPGLACLALSPKNFT